MSESEGDYFDDQTIEVRFVPFPMQPPTEVWFVEAPTGTPWPATMPQEVIETTLLELGGAAGSNVMVPDHVLDVHRSRHEWGASAASLSVIAEVSDFVLSEAGSAVVGAAVMKAWDYFRKRFSTEVGAARHARPDLEDARQRARYRIATAYRVSVDELELLAEEENEMENSFEFDFRGPDGERFTVSLFADASGWLRVGRLRREEPTQE